MVFGGAVHCSLFVSCVNESAAVVFGGAVHCSLFVSCVNVSAGGL